MSAPQNTPKPQHFPATRQYDSDDFERFRPWDNDPATKDNANTQHNIMMLVGNGFDIAVLSELNANYLTDYRSFFNHLQMKNFNRDNSLFKRMDELRRKDEAAETLGEEGYPNWSDFEYLLQEHVDDLSTHGGTFYTAQIKHDLEELQHEFSEFLEMVVSPSILKKLDSEARDKKWAYRTFANFTADLSENDYRTFDLPDRAKHYDVFAFNVVNFNFTPLLENYLSLDQHQFDPHIHKDVDTNFEFRRNPRNHSFGNYRESFGNAQTGCSAYLVAEFYHPHGNQHTPRSLLFGIDADDVTASRGAPHQMGKPYWAQTPRRYKKMIAETDLFIIFGSSRGTSDKWWWRHVLKRLAEGGQVIIYQYVPESKKNTISENSIKNEFIRENYDPSMFGGNPLSEYVSFEIFLNIFVVTYSDPSTISAFGFNKTPYNPTDRNPAKLPKLQ